MRRPHSRAALIPAAVVFVCAPMFTRVARGSLIDVGQTTALTANAVADLSGGGTAGDHKEADDTADLAKRAVAANASAHVTIDTQTAVDGTGDVAADITQNDAGFSLTGRSSTSLPNLNPLTANVTGVSNTLVPFTVADGATGHIRYTIDISSMVLMDQKVTVELRRDGESVSDFHKVYGSSKTSSIDDIAPGSYKLLLVTGSISTSKGIAGETGSANYQVTVSAEPQEPPTSIPLPAGWMAGAPVLGLALLAVLRPIARARRV
jgi:hypothetical protein